MHVVGAADCCFIRTATVVSRRQFAAGCSVTALRLVIRAVFVDRCILFLRKPILRCNGISICILAHLPCNLRSIGETDISKGLFASSLFVIASGVLRAAMKPIITANRILQRAAARLATSQLAAGAVLSIRLSIDIRLNRCLS